MWLDNSRELLAHAKDLWPRHADFSPMTAREEVMLKIMCELIERQTQALLGTIESERKRKILGGHL